MNHERLRLWCVGAGAALVVGWILLPPNAFQHGARHNARRVGCQSNLKEIGRAAAMYSQDYDDFLPRRSWVASLLPYIKADDVFQCHETNSTPNTTDYFWNARLSGQEISKVLLPAKTINSGDGQDDAPLDAALSSLPQAWLNNKSSPAYRHLGGANYGFADGHVKWLKPERVSNAAPPKTGGPSFAIR